MPITSITIENFKGIGEKAVTIPIRPITLLFGKNSSGKSTVLQALRYFFEVKNQWPNLGRIEMSGGLNTDLDNFHSLVHRHELDRKIRIRVKNVLNEWDEVVTGWKEGDQEGHYSGRFGLGLNMRHLGPFREVHEDEIPQTPDESRWQKGLGAWDALARDPKLVEKTNHYLKEVLQLGYTIKQPEPGQNFQLHDENNEIDVGLSDVGVGIAQVIPVVAGALDDSPNTFAVEQPELHVHPAVQVALGDVFIDSVKHRDQAHDQAIAEFSQKIENALEIKEFIENLEESKRIEPLIIELEKNIAKKDPEFIELLKENIDAIEKSNRTLLLIETHSEHLLLRLLRRVRETTEGEQTEHPLTPDDLSVIYVRSTPEGVEFIPISVTEDGDFEVLWPEGFFDERVEELF